jgi:hypothetical protein
MGLGGSARPNFRAGVVSAKGREEAHMRLQPLQRGHFRSDAEQSIWRGAASDILHATYTLCSSATSSSRSHSYEKAISDLELVSVPPQRR